MVDVTLFPIDTIKTRLQSRRGFWQSGGFGGIYKGLAPAAAGSVPTAALFFCAYEGLKGQLGSLCPAEQRNSPYIHMAAASCAEVVSAEPEQRHLCPSSLNATLIWLVSLSDPGAGGDCQAEKSGLP